MVKNTGGNKSKKVGRKNVMGANLHTQDVRRVNDPGEMYAEVAKIYSSRRCDVIGSDGKTYQCTVRGKFLKNKRGANNALVPGVWVLIGFYDWEVRGDGSKSCDLLEIYTPMEKEKLKQFEAQQLGAIMHIESSTGGGSEGLTFSSFKEAEEDELVSSSGEEDDDEEKKKVTPTLPAPVVQKKETVQEQMDWLNINERDI